MSGLNIEDCIILLDTSRSMLRSDFAPSRLKITIDALITLIEMKFSIGPNDRIGIVTFAEKGHKLQDLTSNKDVLINSLKKVKISGKSDISDGLALSIQILASEIRKIGGKVIRILLFSDDRLGKMTNRLIKLANAANGLGIFIDSLIAGTPPRALNYSVMKNLSTITSGDFAYFNNKDAYTKAVHALSSKKDFRGKRSFS